MINRSIICSAALILSACGMTKDSRAQEYVRTLLTDPDSAKFGAVREFSIGGGRKRLCVEVNSKNKMGGYTGMNSVILDENVDETFTYYMKAEGECPTDYQLIS